MRAWSLHRKSTKSKERVASFDGPFIISRESFEVKILSLVTGDLTPGPKGYRRSFDIAGSSPIFGPSSTFPITPRLSLDSNVNIRNESISSRTGSRLRPSSIGKAEEDIVAEGDFEDIKLEDDEKASRRSILSRLGFAGRTGASRKREGEELRSFKPDDN